MNGPKIVTAFVLISLTTVGCRAKFTKKNSPDSVPATTSVAGPVPTTTVDPRPTSPVVPVTPVAPVVPTSGPTSGPGIVPQVIDPQLGCPTSGDRSIDPRRALQRKTITFKTGRQMIWRKNCEGRIYSKQWENLTRAISQVVTIRSTSNVTGMMVINRTTCDTPSIQAQQIIGRNGEFRLPVSTSPSNNAMLVRPGQNLIDYEIPGGEKGTLILTVRVNNRSEDCIVIRDRGCEAVQRAGSDWTDNVFTSGN